MWIPRFLRSVYGRNFPLLIFRLSTGLSNGIRDSGLDQLEIIWIGSGVEGRVDMHDRRLIRKGTGSLYHLIAGKFDNLRIFLNPNIFIA